MKEFKSLPSIDKKKFRMEIKNFFNKETQNFKKHRPKNIT